MPFHTSNINIDNHSLVLIFFCAFLWCLLTWELDEGITFSFLSTKDRSWLPLNSIKLHFVICFMCICPYVKNLKFWALKIYVKVYLKTWSKKDHLSASWDGQQVWMWYCMLALHWPFRNLRACHFNKKTSYPSPSPINHRAMLGRHRQNHQEKALWCKSSIKSNCHAESPQQAPLH